MEWIRFEDQKPTTRVGKLRDQALFATDDGKVYLGQVYISVTSDGPSYNWYIMCSSIGDLPNKERITHWSHIVELPKSDTTSID